MKNVKILSLILAFIIVAATFISCDKGQTEPEKGTETVPEQTTAESQTDDVVDEEYTEIAVVDAKGSAGLVGDFKAAFSPETSGENIITGDEQNGVCYSLYAALPSPTVIKRLVLTAPTKGQTQMASVTIDASTDGVNWVTIKELGSTSTAGKTYSLNVADETAYLFVRVRQADEHRTESFRFRNVVIHGIAKSGSAGNLADIVEEVDESKLIGIDTIVVSSTKSGEPADVFKDNENSWSANASAGNPNFLLVAMTKKTEIRSITVKLWGSNRQARGTVVQVSEDCAKWVDLYTIPDLKQEDGTELENGEYTFYINDTTKYSFVRLVQRSDLAAWDWTLNTVLVYGIESDEAAEPLDRKYIDAKTVEVTYYDSHVDVHGVVKDSNETDEEYNERTAGTIWDTSDTTTILTLKEHPDLTAREEFWISGKFASATVITEITYYSPANYAGRARTSYFEASVDGVTWTKIATLPSAASSFDNSATIKLTVDDDTAYSYIRLVQGEGFYKYYWTLGTVEIKGVSD